MDITVFGLLAVLSVVVCWQGLALFGLTRRLLDVEARLKGEKATAILNYQIGDPLPKAVMGTSQDGRPATVTLGEGLWLVFFVTEGCTACGRALKAAAKLVPRPDDMEVVALLPQVHDVQETEHESIHSWLNSLEEAERRLLVTLNEEDWLRFGPQGTPTILLARDGKVASIDVGLATRGLLQGFLRDNGVLPASEVGVTS